MTTTTRDTGPQRYRLLGLGLAAVALVAAVFAWSTGFGVAVAFLVGAALTFRHHTWVAICAAAWGFVFLAVLVIPGPYDSPAGRAAVGVLGFYAAIFLAAWLLGRKLAAGRSRPATVDPDQAVDPDPTVAADPVMPSAAASTVEAAPARRARGTLAELAWPAESRLRPFLLVVLALALTGAALKFRGEVPLFADNPDAAREAVRLRSNLLIGLLSECWGLGLAIALLRALTGRAQGRWVYILFVVVFAFGAALGASKNSVLVGVVPALVAALSVRRSATISRKNRWRASLVVVVIGAVAVGAAVFLGGQRTLAGTGTFEDQFRAQYGASPLHASVGSLDLSLSSSVETFGRLWQQREEHPPAWGRYSITFTGSVGERLFGPADLYGITAALSRPFYMNTATFVAIPLLDYGPVGAAFFLGLLGLCVGIIDRRLTFSTGPAQHLSRAFVIYFATFGVYELYPVVQPFWLTLAPGLVALYLLGDWRRWNTRWWQR